MSKKKLKALICAALAAVTLLSGCGNADIEETTASTSLDDKYKTYPEIDYMSLDLSQYITLGQYKGFDIEIAPKHEVTDQEVADKIAADLFYSGYTKKVTDRAVTKDDTLSISYVGIMDGVEFEGGTGSKDKFTVYDGGGFIDGFADGLIGAMPGVVVDVNVTFPENYHNAEFSGKPAVFKVTVHHIYEAQELTDEIAKSITGGEHPTAAAMTEYYKNRLIEDNETEYKNNRADLVWSKIFNGVTNENIPQSMIDELYNYQLYWAQYYANMYGTDLDTFLKSNGDTRESLLEETKNNIFTNMVIYAIMKAEGMTLSNDEYLGYIKDTGYTESELLKQYTKDELVDMFLYTKTFYAAVEWQNFTEKEAA